MPLRYNAVQFHQGPILALSTIGHFAGFDDKERVNVMEPPVKRKSSPHGTELIQKQSDPRAWPGGSKGYRYSAPIRPHNDTNATGKSEAR